VRIGDHYRAIGIREGDIVAWFWIGTHEDCNRSFGFDPLCPTSSFCPLTSDVPLP
jgi:hypothetical protein